MKLLILALITLSGSFGFAKSDGFYVKEHFVDSNETALEFYNEVANNPDNPAVCHSGDFNQALIPVKFDINLLSGTEAGVLEAEVTYLGKATLPVKIPRCNQAAG